MLHATADTGLVNISSHRTPVFSGSVKQNTYTIINSGNTIRSPLQASATVTGRPLIVITFADRSIGAPDNFKNDAVAPAVTCSRGIEIRCRTIPGTGTMNASSNTAGQRFNNTRAPSTLTTAPSATSSP